MGMTKVFYFVKKNQFTPEKIHEKLLEESASDYQFCTVFYQKTIDWLPVFDVYYCEGTYSANKEFMISLEKIFGSPVIALSTFDSDVAFVSIYENGKLHRYVHADEVTLEEFGFEEYEPVIPEKLEKYVDGKELQKIWNEKYVFAEDVIRNIAQLLNTFLVFYENFYENDVGDDVETISR